jgi:hypothetical protein
MRWCFAGELWWIATCACGEGCVFIGDLRLARCFQRAGEPIMTVRLSRNGVFGVMAVSPLVLKG